MKSELIVNNLDGTRIYGSALKESIQEHLKKTLNYEKYPNDATLYFSKEISYVETEILEFSKNYPDLLFRLFIYGESIEDLTCTYFTNGKMRNDIKICTL